MRHLLILPILLFALVSSVSASDRDEITLFDSQGEAVAYVSPDDENNIYLWSGKPVAYLKREGREVHVYGFNGKHLGWFVGGIIRDHEGNGVGFIQGAVTTLTKLEPLKSLKALAPLKNLAELPPLQPLWTNKFSGVPLRLFLIDGSEHF
jgi:hypothetical protein